MLPIILLLGGGVVAAFAVRFATRGDSFQVERWSPWERLDPEMKRTLSGPEQGLGAVYGWSGNKKAGEGRMEIVSADPPRSLGIKLDFIRPFESDNHIDFILTPAGGGTQVRWLMHGPNTTSSKLMQTVISMDRMVGGDFERGLAQLKSEAEGKV